MDFSKMSVEEFFIDCDIKGIKYFVANCMAHDTVNTRVDSVIRRFARIDMSWGIKSIPDPYVLPISQLKDLYNEKIPYLEFEMSSFGLSLVDIGDFDYGNGDRIFMGLGGTDSTTIGHFENIVTRKIRECKSQLVDLDTVMSQIAHIKETYK